MRHTFNLKFFLRFLNRHRLYTAINVFGFSVSLMFVILIAAYVAKELSADRHHVNGDRIYRFEHQDFAYSAYAAGRVLQDRFPEIESYCVVSYENKTLRIGEEYMQVAVDCVDSSFFHMFTIELEQGDPRHVLATRDGVVINSKFAKTLFGEESPMGKVLDIDDRQLTVTGVFADFPYGIFRTPQLITSIFNTDNLWCIESYMDCHSWELFLMACRNADLPAKTEPIRQCIKETGDYAFSHDEKAILRPMKDIFFDGFHFQNGGNKKFVLILAVVGLLILVFAVINYINLSVAQTGFRAREMAMRRMLGGTRRQLYSSIVAESILLCLFSFLLALLFSVAAENAFGWLVRTDVSVREAIDPYTAAGGLLFILLLGIVSGSIPAALISSYRPIEVMKGTFRQKTKMVYSKILIVFQYFITIALIGCTLVMIRQIRFMLRFDMGYGTEALIQADVPGNLMSSYAPLRNDLMTIGGVESVSLATFTPSSGGNNDTDPSDPDHPISYQVFMGDTAFIRTCGFEIVRDNDARTDQGTWLNEEAIRANGLTVDADEFSKNHIPIAGVLRDFRFRDLSQPVGPAKVYVVGDDNYCMNVLVRISTANDPALTFQQVSQTIEKHTDGRPFSCHFTDQLIRDWYENQLRTANAVGYLTLIAILIAALGLLAMSTYYIRQRSQEIAMRKVYGSTNAEVLRLLIAGFMKMVAVGFVLAVPVTWYIMREWLSAYTERIAIGWLTFAAAGLTAAAIALLTVYWQSCRAANANPVDSVKK